MMFINEIPSQTLLMNMYLYLCMHFRYYFLFFEHHFSFRTGKGVGYSAHFSGPMLVLECAVKSGKRENKVLHHLVKFEFHPQKVSMSNYYSLVFIKSVDSNFHAF